jgi:uncharacterized NAD(P)/FAD-binding protein YdhS
VETIAIVGGGFSGTMAAVNLARLGDRPLRVRLINRGYPAGRGVAYSTRRPEHLLNVVARNMSALPDHPNHFLDWLRSRTEYADTPDAVLRETFVPRRVYGDYLRSLSLGYFSPVDPRQVKVEPVDDVAVDIEPTARGCRVMLTGGSAIDADRVVLATGNQPPAELPGPDGPFRHPAYVDNPWAALDGRLPDPAEDVVLVGTGLTTVDVILSLSALGWKGTVHAVSRHGLLPLSHFRGIEYPDFPPPDPETLGLAALVESAERHCGRLRERGENPAIVVDRLRPHTQRIWQALTADEKRTFCDRYMARWNVTRHRVAAEVHAEVMNAVSAGRLKVWSGKVVALADAGPRVRVEVEAAGGVRTAIEGGLVVNCTGPQTRFSATETPLFRNLLARGLVCPDELDMGIQADADFAAIDADGRRSPYLYAIGPLLRGTLWETTAVPELRGQAMRVAQTLLAGGHPAWGFAPTSADVIEYCI